MPQCRLLFRLPACKEDVCGMAWFHEWFAIAYFLALLSILCGCCGLLQTGTYGLIVISFRFPPLLCAAVCCGSVPQCVPDACCSPLGRCHSIGRGTAGPLRIVVSDADSKWRDLFRGSGERAGAGGLRSLLVGCGGCVFRHRLTDTADSIVFNSVSIGSRSFGTRNPR